MGGFEEGGGWDAPTPPNFGNANLVAGSLTIVGASGPYVPDATLPGGGASVTVVKVTGIGGSVQVGRFVGHTVFGAPTSGTYLTGDWILSTASQEIWRCSAGGTPGTWSSRALTTGVYSVFDFGAVGNGVQNDGASTRAAITAAGTAGRVSFPPGVFMQDAELFVPGQVQLVGSGRSTTTLRAISGTFPINTPIVHLGDNAETLAFACRCEDLSIDANNIAGSVCVFTEQAQEQSGLFRCTLYNFVDSGFKSIKIGLFATHYNVQWCEITGGTGALSTTRGIKIDGGASGAIQIPDSFDSVTINFQVGFTPAAAVQLDGIQCTFSNIHIENCTDGILIGSVRLCSGMTLINITGAATVTGALVHVSNATTSSAYTFIGISGPAMGACITDDQFSISIPTAIGGLMVIGFYAVGTGGSAGQQALMSSSDTAPWRVRTQKLIHVAPFGEHQYLEADGGRGFRWNLSNDGTFRVQKTANGFGAVTATPLLIDGNSLAQFYGQVYPGDTGLGQQVSGGILHTTAIPNNAQGNNNDWCISDNGHLYFRTGAAWVQKI